MQLPARIGKYELTEFLGGGMSHVYRATDTLMGRTVAIKILTETACQDTAARERFLLEARMAGNIAHENVISIYDFGEDEQKRPFMVMEFLQGEDLREAIKNSRTGNLQDKIRIALPIAKALQCVHDHKLIHRDVKPENVHINKQRVVKLMDFGIAKAEGFSMTQVGFVLGTPYYMAPEQVTGAQITAQVDVYAFGVLLFELFAGVRPVQGETVERIFYCILNEPLNLEPLRTAGAPQFILDLVAKCTAKKPEDRPQGFGPVIAELERMLALSESPTGSLPMPTQAATAAATATMPQPAAQPVAPAPDAAPSRPGWLIPAVVVGGLLVVAAIYLAVRPKSPEVAGPVTPPAKTEPKPDLAPVLTTPTGEMVLVSEGEFLFGENKERRTLPAFYIDKTEVSNAAYQEFCRATGHALPTDFPKSAPDLPVVNVTFGDAHDFAAWAGKRLPKAEEWEKAARGKDGRSYPWGENSDPAKANVGKHALRPVNGFPEGASPYGALQMVGNVWELVDQSKVPPEEALVRFQSMKPPATIQEAWYAMRGQSSGEPLLPDVIWDSATVPARWKDKYIGFRCVKDPGK